MVFQEGMEVVVAIELIVDVEDVLTLDEQVDKLWQTL